MDMDQMLREKALDKARQEKRATANYLDEGSISHPNPHYVKKELIDGVVVETMPNIPKEVEEEL